MTDFSTSALGELQDFDFSRPAVNDVDRPSEAPMITRPPAYPTYTFDYSDVSAAVAEEAEATADRIRRRLRTSIIDTGNDLLAIKGKLTHGKFGKWLEHHFGMSERSAQNYMNAASAFGASPKIVELLPPTTVYKLAAKGAPYELRLSVIKEIESGITPDPEEIELRISSAKSEERRKREEELVVRKEEREWQKYEQALRNAGKSDADVELERKRWDTKKARKERLLQRRLAEEQKREEEALRESEERTQNAEKMAQIAAKMAAILKKRLGGDFQKARDAILKISYEDLRAALQAA